MRRRRCAIAGCRSGVGSPLAAEGGRVSSRTITCSYIVISHIVDFEMFKSCIGFRQGPVRLAMSGHWEVRMTLQLQAAHRQGALAVTFNLIVRARSSSAMAAFRRSNTSIATQLREGIF